MEIVYLDQNKWIELARAHTGKACPDSTKELYTQLTKAVESGKVLFPLSASHIIETSKRNDAISRAELVETQAVFSRGYCYRSRKSRLTVEIGQALQRIFNLTPSTLPLHWAIAPCFLEAFEPMDSLIASTPERQRIERLLKHFTPAETYIEFMKQQDDSVRRLVHNKITNELSSLIDRIENRRTKLSGEKFETRRRIHLAQLFLEHQEKFIRTLISLGIPIEEYEKLGEKLKPLIEDVPTLNIEAELAARLEAEPGPLSTNDFFDMQSFYTAIPYCSWIIAEKASISRAKQAKFHSKYNVKLSHSILELINRYQA